MADSDPDYQNSRFKRSKNKPQKAKLNMNNFRNYFNLLDLYL
jgi:hypothetical protein